MAEQMTGAEMVVQALIDQGVTHIFGYPGGAALPIYDAIFQQDDVQQNRRRLDWRPWRNGALGNARGQLASQPARYFSRRCQHSRR
jgi:hypothetical protein